MNKIIKKAAVILTIFALLISSVPVYAASASISKKSVTLYIGQSTALKVKGQNGKVTWKSANPKIAAVNKSGIVTAKKAGKTKVTAKVNKKTLTCNVTVKKTVKVKKITLKKNISLNVGESYTLKANISPSSAANKKVSWKSSNKSIATVNAAGAVRAKKSGSATIIVTAKDGSGKKAYCKVTVKKKASGSQTEERVKSLSLNGKTILGIGNTAKFSVVNKPENLKKSFSWSSSNPKIATVSSDGTVKAIAEGTVKITAITNDQWKDSITATINIKKADATPTPSPTTPAPVTPSKTLTGISASCSVAEISSINEVTTDKIKVIGIYSDGSTETISGYRVNGVFNGTDYTYTVTTNDGKFSTSFTVKRKKSDVTLSDIEAVCLLDEVEKGYQFKTSDFVVKGIYSDGSQKDIGFKIDISYSDGKYIATITADRFLKQLNIPVRESTEPTVTGITYSLKPSSVYVGENLSPGQLVVTVSYSDGTKKDITDFSCDFSPKQDAGTYTFTVSWNGFTKKVPITVIEKKTSEPTLTGLDASYSKSYIFSDETPAASDIVLTGTYSDGSRKNITDFTFDYTPVAEHKGKATIVVHYAGNDLTLNVTSIIKTEPKSVEFEYRHDPVKIGESINPSSITVTATDYLGNKTPVTDFSIIFDPKQEAGTYPFTVSYKGFSQEFEVTVK